MFLTQEPSRYTPDANIHCATPGKIARRPAPCAVSDAHVRLRAVACALMLLCVAAVAKGQTPRPVLLSEPTSTRALALESVTQVSEPFAPESAIVWGADRRTRVRLFAMNLAPRPGEDVSSVVGAFAEDGAGLRYTLKTEYVGAASGAAGVSEVVLRLSDDLGDVGDVLVWISYGGLSSNRVRVGVGHVGGGPPDDAGAVPTQPLLLAGGVIQNSDGLAGVQVNLVGGTSPVTSTTAADGSYSFIVAPLGTYTLTPSAPFYDFEPATRSLDSVQGSSTGLFFTARRQTHVIFGQVHDEAGRELFNYGVRLTGASGFEPRTTTTDDSGQFTFFDVPAGFDYTLTPTDETLATFSPTQTGPLTANVNVNIAARRRTYAIHGYVADDAGPVGGVSVVVEGYGETKTDATGEYVFAAVPVGLGYKVFVNDPDFTYEPPSFKVESLQHDEQFDFKATPHIALRGRITDPDGKGVFGITVLMDGARHDATYTDAGGNYVLYATARGDYTVKPTQFQTFYTFSPASVSLTGVDSPRTNDFKASISSSSSPSYVLEFDGGPEDVDYATAFKVYDVFWPSDVDLGHFFWEAWAMPREEAGATYIFADGYGGGHALLFGVANFNTSEAGRFQLLGNIWDGNNLTYFNSDEGPAPGEWGHYAAGWDGQYIVTYFNGVPVGRTKWKGPRRTPGPGGGGGRLYVGGSNHSNFVGRIAQVRGYEDSNPREDGGSSVYSAFRPETVFGVGGSLMSWYFRPGNYVDDLSLGYRGVPHPGLVRGWEPGNIFPCDQCRKPVFVVDPTAPNFADPAHPGTPPAPVAPPSPVPSGALVFDSFSRRNSTYALAGLGGLGSTEGGTAGALAWHTGVAPAAPQPFGILNGRAVLLADARSLTWVGVGGTYDNFDVRVARHPGNAESGRDTGLSFRVVDADNYFFAYTTEGTDPAVRLLTVGYYANGQRTTLAAGLAVPEGWTTLRAVTNAAGLVEVYADNARLYTAQNFLMATATGAGLYNDGPGLALTNRWDDFAIFATSQH